MQLLFELKCEMKGRVLNALSVLRLQLFGIKFPLHQVCLSKLQTNFNLILQTLIGIWSSSISW